MPLSPVKFSGRKKEDLIEYLQEELTLTIGDRQELDAKWENALIQSRAQKPKGEVDFPFEGASNEEFPLTDMHFQPVYADFYQTLHAPETYFSVTAKRPDRVAASNAIKEGLSAVEKKFIKMKRVNTRALLDLITFGTSIYKNHWHEERFNKQDYNAAGDIITVTHRLSEPRVEHVPIQKFYFPAYSWSLDPKEQGGTPWQAQRFDMSPAKFREWAKGGEEVKGFSKKDIKEVEKWITTEDKPVDDEIRREDEYVPFRDDKIKLYEMWVKFDVNGDGIDEDITVIFHLETRSILRALYNPLMHGKWPFKAVKYLPWFGIYGRGIAEVDEWAQDSMTKLWNAQMDNALLANTRMYSAPLGSNIQPGESVYPGKIWMVGANEKVSEIKMSDIYASMPSILSQTMQFSEMRTGVSELRQGNLTGLPSRTPATSLLALLQEGNKRFDMILNAFRDVHSEIGTEILQTLVQHSRHHPIRWQSFFINALGEEDGMLFLEFLNSSVANVEESFGVAVSATSAQVNKEVEKQSFIGLMQVTGQIYGQIIQTALLMSQVQDPLVQQTAAAAYTAGTEMLKRLLERFDIQNPSEYVPNLQALQQSGALEGGQGQQSQPGLGITGQAGGVPPQGIDPRQLAAILGI